MQYQFGKQNAGHPLAPPPAEDPSAEDPSAGAIFPSPLLVESPRSQNRGHAVRTNIPWWHIAMAEPPSPYGKKLYQMLVYVLPPQMLPSNPVVGQGYDKDFLRRDTLLSFTLCFIHFSCLPFRLSYLCTCHFLGQVYHRLNSFFLTAQTECNISSGSVHAFGVCYLNCKTYFEPF